MGQQVGDAERVALYQGWLDRSKAAFEAKLWNGQYYNFDAANGPYSNSIMADQLAGQWYAEATGLPPIVPLDHATTALKTIFDYNVGGFVEGQLGAVNGMRPDGTVDLSGRAAQEVWPDVTYMLAAAMLERDWIHEGWATAWSVFNVTYNYGFWFRTPAAYRSDRSFRAGLSMRPLAIWAIEQVIETGNAPPVPDGAEEIRLTSADGTTVPGLYFAPPQPAAPAVLLLHMRDGRKENWTSLAQLLQQNGYAALAFDFRGHGQSRAVMNWYWTDQDVIAAYNFLANRPEVDSGRIALIGASIGTQEAITFAALHPDQVRGVAMLSTFASNEIEWGVKTYPGPILLVATKGDVAATQVTRQLARLVSEAEIFILEESDRHGTQMLRSELEIEPILLDWLEQVVQPQ
jgi:dienelactone hydrolase